MVQLLDLLVENNRISVSTADKAKLEFSRMLNDKTLLDKFTCFDINQHHLDSFYVELIGHDINYSALWCVIQKVLVLSHRNACVESGFSINEDIVSENMKQTSLICYRFVFDEIQCAGGVLNITISPGLLKFVRAARGRSREPAERNVDNVKKRQLEEQRQKSLKEQFDELHAKRLC